MQLRLTFTKLKEKYRKGRVSLSKSVNFVYIAPLTDTNITKWLTECKITKNNKNTGHKYNKEELKISNQHLTKSLSE